MQLSPKMLIWLFGIPGNEGSEFQTRKIEHQQLIVKDAWMCIPSIRRIYKLYLWLAAWFFLSSSSYLIHRLYKPYKPACPIYSQANKCITFLLLTESKNHQVPMASEAAATSSDSIHNGQRASPCFTAVLAAVTSIQYWVAWLQKKKHVEIERCSNPHLEYWAVYGNIYSNCGFKIILWAATKYTKCCAVRSNSQKTTVISNPQKTTVTPADPK